VTDAAADARIAQAAVLTADDLPSFGAQIHKAGQAATAPPRASSSVVDRIGDQAK
jgi:hypothetical protein